ncbi:hypothetical protein A2U01_0078462, partial [Trifolium medium]|nr:hypothetical protein [Trifolium medium]
KYGKSFDHKAEQRSKASTRPHRTVLLRFPVLAKRSEVIEK